MIIAVIPSIFSFTCRIPSKRIHQSQSLSIFHIKQRKTWNLFETKENLIYEALKIIPNDVIESIDVAISSIPPISSNISMNSRNIHPITSADLTSLTGYNLYQSSQYLYQLSCLTQADLQVTKNGDIIYLFPSRIREIIQSKSRLQQISQFSSSFSMFFYKCIRISFGLALISSLVIIFSTIFVLSSSRSTDSNENDRKTSKNSNFINLDFLRIVNFLPNEKSRFVDDSNVYSLVKQYQGFTSSPINAYNVRDMRIGMIESFFSFTFGDSDPNLGIYLFPVVDR